MREQIGNDNIKSALSLFTQLSKPNSVLVCSDLTEMIELAGSIELKAQLTTLSFVDKYLFICAPVSATDMVMDKYMEWLVSYSKRIHLCEELRDLINTFIENSLKKRGLHRKCPECSKKLPVHHSHKVCDECFKGKHHW